MKLFYHITLLVFLLLSWGVPETVAQGYIGKRWLVAYKPYVSYLPTPKESIFTASPQSWLTHTAEIEYLNSRITSFGVGASYTNYKENRERGNAFGVSGFLLLHNLIGINPIGNYVKIQAHVAFSHEEEFVVDNWRITDGTAFFATLSFGKRIPVSRRLLFDYAFQFPIPYLTPNVSYNPYSRSLGIQLGLTFAAK